VKVRLLKGPLHNKFTIVRDGDRELIVQTASMDPFDWTSANPDPHATAPVNIRTVRYKLLVVTNPYNKNDTIPCVNQRGEVLFQYDKDS